MVERVSTRVRLGRRDRISAQLATWHGVAAVLGEVSMLVELGWAHGRTCSACAADQRSHGGASGSGVCLVGAVGIAAGCDVATGHRAIDGLWQQLHRGRPRPSVNWYPPGTRHDLQVRDLRSWNDRPGGTTQQSAALIRATVRTGQAAIERLRAGA